MRDCLEERSWEIGVDGGLSERARRAGGRSGFGTFVFKLSFRYAAGLGWIGFRVRL